ncbi:PorP/SprF family type IX secretion system membrane protein [Portibacter lacus]|uniref:Type IX secretion system membrane protein PorP/SprF n=1 Tax=Portibacter lacus TaxID=1099794 RepID=A0AA37SU57_9BACT|nr:PorP/SprF family type IX secretion system membrane protein [Portibacter lacus]GLR19689.1 hypothetical protein GCM10007940_43050 [Portibacter lacus]
MSHLIKYTLILLGLTILSDLHAQDALFSQMNKSRNLLNPALLALQNNDLDIDLNFREQGASVSGGLPIRTFQVLANFRSHSFKSDQFTYGLSILSDKGGTGHVGSNMAHLNIGYLKKLTDKYSKIGEHYIGIGAAFGGGQKSVNWSRFWFGNQFDTAFNTVDETKDPREDEILANTNGRSGMFADLNAGLTWYANLKEGLSADLGFSIYHLTQPNISLFENGNEPLTLRYNMHGSLHSKVSDLLSISPSAIFIRQGKSLQFLLGSGIGMDNEDDYEFAIDFGFFARMVSNEGGVGMESLFLTLNSDYNNFRFGLAYDITVSSLAKYNNSKGAWEFRLGYTIPHLRNKSSKITNGNKFHTF